MKAITSMEVLEKVLHLTQEEKGWIEGPGTVPLGITEHFFRLIDKNDINDPLRKQFVPTCFENQNEVEDVNETLDPQQEVKYSINSRLVHRYKNRVAFLVTDLCPAYCRHCFRRRFTGHFLGVVSDEIALQSAEYVGNHPEIKEILFTGGDVLTLSNQKLEALIKLFREKSPHLLIRICTRYLTNDPERINQDFINMLKKYKTAPFYVMTQFNHPREISKETIKSINLLADNGFPLMNQTVLLKGVNDDVNCLEELFNTLLSLRVKPYYLFQLDYVKGTAHFRVPLEQGFKIQKELTNRLSGLANPFYTLDLPLGGGKVNFSQTIVEKEMENKRYKITSHSGEVRYYPMG